ncbi:MAG: DUF368 domain-containing protein [Congregibacter sp.]
MGAADIVPGVSGGTIAFITGIYHRLLAAISSVDVGMLRTLLRGDVPGVWRHLDGGFLLALLLGILTSAFTLASLISGLLESHPLFVWSLFFGLILASGFMLLGHVSRWGPGCLIGLLAGTAIAISIALIPSMTLQPSSAGFFFAGFVAICAMILPGVSGSFILVLLGMYPPVLAAIDNLDFVRLGIFATGAASGLLVFSRLVRLLLERFHAPTLATLTGFLFGSLLLVWPWQLLPVDGQRAVAVLPSRYATELGNPQILVCLLLMCVGAGFVWLIEKYWGGAES